MREPLVSFRNRAIRTAYTGLAKPAFFALDPELVHDRVSTLGKLLGSNPLGRGVTRTLFGYTHPMLAQNVAGIHFRSPIGLGAGFDKNARLLGVLPAVGFGFLEVGSVTQRPCAGNRRPRLARLPCEGALVVNYGLRNQGAARVAARLARSRCPIPVGVSLAPTNDERTAQVPAAIAEYVAVAERFAHLGAYTVLNLSCPNTCNDQPFMEPKALEELLAAVTEVETSKPIFLKFSPDVSLAKIDSLLEVAFRYRVAGVIAANLTKDRAKIGLESEKIPPGGISGKPLQPLADRLVAHVYRETGGKLAVIGCGGVFTAEDAYRKITLGASLVQLVTGMIFEGPQAISAINQGLVRLLQRDGFSSIGEAVGTANLNK